MPQPAEGEVLTRTLWLSLDPYMRGRMSDAASYATPVQIDAPMMGETVGEVVLSRDPRFSPGQVVLGAWGWQSHIVTPPTSWCRCRRAPLIPPISGCSACRAPPPMSG